MTTLPAAALPMQSVIDLHEMPIAWKSAVPAAVLSSIDGSP